MKEIIKILKKRSWSIGVMESCTGGAMANCVTNIPGASDVFKEGKVTYSDEAKIRAGVDRGAIKKWGVCSIETAEGMAKKTVGDIGVGITGSLPGEVFVAIRRGEEVKSIKFNVESKNENKIESRIEMKKEVVGKIVEMIIENI